MLTPFAAETGGTFVVPGSHRWPRNPAAGDMSEMDQDAPYPTECQIEGPAGSVLMYDSRLWHAVASNQSQKRSRCPHRALRSVVAELESHAYRPA